MLTGMLGVRARTYKNQYIVVRGSYGRTANKIENLFGGTNTHGLAGGSIGYCYNSIIGPIEAELNYSNQSRSWDTILEWDLLFNILFFSLLLWNTDSSV